MLKRVKIELCTVLALEGAGVSELSLNRLLSIIRKPLLFEVHHSWMDAESKLHPEEASSK